MSLISDALKAAEAERMAGPSRTREAARQVLHGRAERRMPVAGAAEWLYRPIRVPRHVQVAGGIVLTAVMASTLIVALRPARGSGVADGLTQLTAPLSLVSGETAVALAEGATVNDAGAAAETGEEEAGSDGESQDAGSGVMDQSSSPAPRSSDDLRASADPPAGASNAVESPTSPTAAVAGRPPAAPPTAADRRQLSAQELRVDASFRPNGDLFAAAVQAQQRHDYIGAITLYQQILARERDDVEVLNNLGVSYQALAQYDSARDAFRRALAIQPRYPAAWSNLGVVLGLLGQEAEARTAFAEAIRQDPGNLGTKVNLALLHQRQNLPSEAKRLLQEVVVADPTLAEAHFALAGVFEAEGNVSAALRHYRLFIATSNSRFPQYEPLVAERIARLEGR